MPTGVIDYNRPKNTSTIATNLGSEYQITTTTENTITIDWFLSLDPTAIAQVSTVTISAGTLNDEYALTVTSGGSASEYMHKQVAGDTATTIASFLATLINTNPNVQAVSAGAVITVTSLIPGQAFTLANTDSTTPANVVIATTTANAGTAINRKIAEANVVFSASTTGFPVITLSGQWYDGSATPVLLQAFGPLTGTGNNSLDSIQTAQGIARPSS
jgi:phage tail sheath gpL-like